MRPGGDPGGLAAAARLLVTAAAEIDRAGDGLRDLEREPEWPEAWRGPASVAYRAWDALLDRAVGDAAAALRHAAAGLADLSTGLDGAQAVWDRAGSLAASAGLPLDPVAVSSPLPLLSTDPRVATAAQVAEMVREAGDQAAVADRTAARRFTEAADVAARAGAGAAQAGAGAAAARPDGSALLGRGLEVADRLSTAVGAGLAAVEARARALTRLVRSGREPAASLAAVRTLAAFEQSTFPDTLAAVLPVGGPAITLAANLVGGEDRTEPLLRAVVRSLGQSLGAEAGLRLGIAICGLETAATEGAGAVLCPGIAMVATSAGATLGGTAAVRVYDALGSRSPPHPPSTVPPPSTAPPPTSAPPSTVPPPTTVAPPSTVAPPTGP